MTSEPTRAQLYQLFGFLFSCPHAANPPPPRPNQGLAYSADNPAEALWLAHPRTVADVLKDGGIAPFETSEQLGEDRAARIAMLCSWQLRFPAFTWLKKQTWVADPKGALDVFSKVRKKTQEHNQNFAGDTGEFRFWALACWAWLQRDFYKAQRRDLEGKKLAEDAQHLDAKGRKQVVATARKLAGLVARKSVLSDAGISPTNGKLFVLALGQLQRLGQIETRPRQDDFTPNRDYIGLLCRMTNDLFGDVPPSLIVALAVIKIDGANEVAVTKLVGDYKKAKKTRAKRM
jgi:hypothetical protein